MAPDLSPTHLGRPPASRAHRGAPTPDARLGGFAWAAGLSERDHRIFALALHLLGGAAPDFGEALRAVREAVEALIPAGRVYYLGAAERGPIVGSLVSGVGIMQGAGGVIVVRLARDGRWTVLGDLAP